MRLLLGLLLSFVAFKSHAAFDGISVEPYENGQYPEHFGCQFSYNQCKFMSYPQISGSNCVKQGSLSLRLISPTAPGIVLYSYDITNTCSLAVEAKFRLTSGMSPSVQLRANKRVYLTVSTTSVSDEPLAIILSGGDAPTPELPNVPAPEKPDSDKPYPVSSAYPGQCSPGVGSDRITGFSVVNLTTRTFTEEIPIPGAVFSLVYNSAHYLAGASQFHPDYVVGGWVYSGASFYDRKKNTVFYGTGESLVLEKIPSPRSDNYFRLMDASGYTYSYFGLDGRFEARMSEQTDATLFIRREWKNDGSFAGFTNSQGRHSFLDRARKNIIGDAGEILATAVYSSLGKLESITLPNGARYELTYNADGRLSSFKRPLGKISYFEYDRDGYLTKDSSNNGRSLTLSSTFSKSEGRLDVGVVSNSGVRKNIAVIANSNASYRHFTTDFGSTAVSKSGYGFNEVWDIYGGHSESKMVAGPRWESKYAAETKFTVGSISLLRKETQRPMTNGIQKDIVLQNDSKKAYYSLSYFNEDGFSETVTTPMERRHFKGWNKFGSINYSGWRLGNEIIMEEIFSYDQKGRLTEYNDSRGSTYFSYNSMGDLERVADATGSTVSVEYDGMRRIRKAIYPTGSYVEFDYDLEGNLVGIKPPGRPFHSFDFKMGEIPTSYRPPFFAQGTPGTEYFYDTDGRLSEVKVGSSLISSFRYGENESRLMEVGHSHGRIGISYAKNINNSPTDLVGTLTTSDGVTTNYTYLWMLPKTVDIQGLVRSSLRYQYNADASLASLEVAGVDGKFAGVSIGYDRDGLPVKVGNISLSLDQAGRLQGTIHGLVKSQAQFDKAGSVSYEGYSANGKALTSVSYARDAAGRLIASTFTAPSQRMNYRYDQYGRLIVAQDGSVSRSYSYDENGNRLEFRTGGSVVQALYDEQDRLLSYGQNRYAYSGAGNLLKREESAPLTQKTLVTEYDYDSMGNLRTVKMSDGRLIEYVVDGQNRRIGKKINGKLVQGFIFQSQYQIAAEMDGSGKVVRRFVYGSKFNIPDYVVIGVKEYRVVSDQVGTPKLIVESATGKIVEQLNYDEFGVALDGKHSAYLPFGFAGGLNDRDTGLVRFGARDYDPQIGRWTNRDPILFGGGQSNLYLYSYGDPVNYFDPTGHFGVGGALVGGIIGGLAGSIGAYANNNNANRTDILKAGFVGALTGAVAGAGGGLFGMASKGTELSLAGRVIGSGIVSHLFGLAGNLAGQQIAYGKVDMKQGLMAATLSGAGGMASTAAAVGVTGASALAIDGAVGLSLMPVDVGTGMICK